MLTEEQVAAAKAWRPVIDWRAVDAGRVMDATDGRYQARFVGGSLDGRVLGVPSLAPQRLARVGAKYERGVPFAFKGGVAPPGRWEVYDLREGCDVDAPVYDFKRTRGTG
jgi:hypothetical protein